MAINEVPALDFTEATLGLIEKADGSEVIDGLVAEADLTQYQALAWIVEVQAPGYLPAFSTRGQEAQMLSFWRRHIEDMCSETYESLLQADSVGGREAARQDHELRKLNAARWGVGAAMRFSASHARYTAKWDRREERSTTCAAILKSLSV